MTRSVVIPAHNAAGTIVQAVRSALDQTVPTDEVVVACDGCTDDTASLAREAGARAIELPKANGSVARNAGVREAQGELLFFLDADDWWSREKVEAHTQVWSQESPSFVIDRSIAVRPDGSPAGWYGGLDRTGAAEWHEFLSYRAWASGSSFSVLRTTYDRIGGFREDLNKFQDVDFWVRCAHECGAAHALAQPLTYYRLSDAHTVSKTTTGIEQNLTALFSGWPFVTNEQRDAFASHAFLTAAEVTPWPQSVEMFKKAHWPLSRRFFWKSLYQSLRRSA
jgi:glycosyltransferase involved in cell wall biosynthesis